jgi:penicillin-binding protein 1A
MKTSANRTPPSTLSKLFKWLTLLFIAGCLLGSVALIGLYRHINAQLPEIEILKDVHYQIPLSVYSADGKLMAQFGEKKSSPIDIQAVPGQFVQAFIAAEDSRFFDHPGVDYQGLMRAAVEFARTGEKRQGGSTITMQVARNFFLTRKKTFDRKLKEILLALKIEKEVSKDEILELYLNKIYLGHRAYGIGAAAQVYYGKTIDQLTLAQQAMLAGLPKAPSQDNPVTDPARAIMRRNYVLRRMHELEFISDEAFQQAMKQPTTARLHASSVELRAPYVAEMVRSEMVKRFGESAYSGGYKVFTTIDSRLQNTAIQALRQTLHEYDERHGYRGKEGEISHGSYQTLEALDAKLKTIPKVGGTVPAVVLSTRNRSIEVYLGKGSTVTVEWKGLRWARSYRSKNRQGPAPSRADRIIHKGDIIRVRKTEDNQWRLTQVPDVAGALVSLDPSDGAILALAGGFDFFHSKYNRAIQSKRQPGSGFKPILYTAALEEGYTAASIINDAPIEVEDPSVKGGRWRPENYSGRYYGPTRLRVGLVNSRNIVSIRLMQQIGINKVIESAKRFGLKPEQLPYGLSLALGSGTASPLDMARVYGVFANGGFLIDPYFIDRIENSDNEEIEQAFPKIACPKCENSNDLNGLLAPRVISTQVHFIMNSLLRDVVRRGTAQRAMALGRSDLAGKTGTTNDQRDAWFNGFTPSLVAIAWVGFDSSKPLGNKEVGGRAALPMWMKYMKVALADTPEQPLSEPAGLVTARVNPYTGLLASRYSKTGIEEIFREEYVPKVVSPRYTTTTSRASAGSRKNVRRSGETASSEIQSLF